MTLPSGGSRQHNQIGFNDELAEAPLPILSAVDAFAINFGREAEGNERGDGLIGKLDVLA
jgi:hypothetical protein